jgi:hypothetical protein
MAGNTDPGQPGELDLELGDEVQEGSETDQAENLGSLDEGEGQDGADGEGAGEYGQNQAGEAAEGQGHRVARSGRAETRIRALNEENRQLRARQDQFERQLQQALTQPSAADLERQRQAHVERRSLMSPVDLAADIEAGLRQEFNGQLQRQGAALWDQADHGTYQRELETKPALHRFDDRVAELKRQYPTVSRIDLLDKAIGEAARRGMGAAGTRARTRAAGQAAGQVTRPAGGRGDVAGTRQRTGRTAAERLDGRQI